MTGWHDLGREAEVDVCWNPDPLPAGAPHGPQGAQLILPVQTHSLNIASADCGLAEFPDTDALITQRRRIYVGVRTADCVPVLLYAPDIKAVAAVHAGWKGTLGKLPQLTALRMRRMGASLAEMKAWIGPCVCGDCYEVDSELAGRFIDAGFGRCVTVASPKPHLDLAQACVYQLSEAGLEEVNITARSVCTRHSEVGGKFLCPSWRREPGTQRRLVSCIGLI